MHKMPEPMTLFNSCASVTLARRQKKLNLIKNKTGNARKTNEPSTIWSVFIKLADHANQTSLGSKTWGYVNVNQLWLTFKQKHKCRILCTWYVQQIITLHFCHWGRYGLLLKLQTGNNVKEKKNIVESFQAPFTDNYGLPILISELSTVWKLTKIIHAQQWGQLWCTAA